LAAVSQKHVRHLHCPSARLHCQSFSLFELKASSNQHLKLVSKLGKKIKNTTTILPKQQRTNGERKQEEKAILKITYLEDKQRRGGGRAQKKC